MLSTERQEFETQLGVLFGGFPQFLTPPRIEAYWRGLQKMPLSTFTRCVDQALGESGTDKLPTVNALWQISKRLRTPALPPKRDQEPQFNPLHRFGQRALFRFLKAKGGCSRRSLDRMIQAKNDIVAKAEGSTAEEIRDVLLAAFEPLYEPMDQAFIDYAMDHYTRTGRVPE